MVQYTFARLQPEYAALWAKMIVVKGAEASSQAREIIAGKARYKALESRTGVPWFVLGALNMRESGGNFISWLHNGDPMRRHGVPVQTVNVPAHRPPNPDCSWEDGGYDAIVVCEHIAGIKDWSPEHVAYVAEGYNGWGYRSPARDIPSPYLWGGTSVQRPGKFVRDGVYSSSVMDPQIGVMAILKQIMVLDPEARFNTAPVAPKPPVVAPEPPPVAPEPVPDAPKPSPKATDTESKVKPLPQSKTIWGGIVGYITTVVTAVTSFLPQLNNPYTFAAFVLLLLVGLVGLVMVIRGRIDVNNIVKHLAQDDSQG